MMHIPKIIFIKSSLLKNSLYGVIANVLQTTFASLLFIILARNYNTNDFGEFILAMTVYQLIVAFSTMGLGQWFIREFTIEENKITFTSKFLKIQLGLGITFYLIGIMLAFTLYSESQVRILSLILGTNIVFDNIILAIKSLNIAENKQIKTAVILAIDGLLKFIIGCIVYIYPLTIIQISLLLVMIRFLTLNLFISVGASSNINFNLILNTKVYMNDIKALVLLNWRFIVIGSISVIYWRLSHIIISKILTLQDVANYEISFRIFSVMLILPIIASATIFPAFVKTYNEKKYSEFRHTYQRLSLLFNSFSIVAYAFIVSFADIIVPLAFGIEYTSASLCLKQMFLTILVLPTVLLQANLIVAMKMERMDMYFNIYSLLINVGLSFLGLYFYKSIEIINLSIFISIVIFHILQDALLIKKKIITLSNSILYYILLSAFVLLYQYFINNFNPYLIFLFFCLLFVSLIAAIVVKKKALIPSNIL